MSDSRSDARESLFLIVGASLATVALWLLPFAGLVVYPLRLFVTFVHEAGHALGALLTLGWPHEIAIYWDTSGLTTWEGGIRVVAQAGGYVGATLAGAAMLLLAARRRTVRPTLIGAGVVLVLLTVWLGGLNPLTWITGLLFGGLFIGLGSFAPPRVARFALSFLAVQCMLGAVYDLGTLFWGSFGSSELRTDATLMAEATGGLVPAFVWSVLWTAIALGTLAVALRSYYNMTVDPIVVQDSL